MRTFLCLLSVALVRCLLVSPALWVNADERPECYQEPASACAKLSKNETGCKSSQTNPNNILIFCCGLASKLELEEYIRSLSDRQRVSGFHLRDSQLPELDINVFDDVSPLTSFSITDSTITRLNGDFADQHLTLKCLNISQNTLNETNPHLLLKLHNVNIIVFSNNINTTSLPEFPNTKVNFYLDISGNRQLECKYLINLTTSDFEAKINRNYINKNATLCSPPQAKLFNSLVYVKLERVEQSIIEIKTNCPNVTGTDRCSCTVHSSDANTNQTFVYQALVNCSNKQMTTLPSKLPSNTRVLDISNNNITSLDRIGNATYHNVRELYADNNKISSLNPLEGTPFLFHFQNLTLRNNKIDQIPIHVLSNVFDRYYGTTILLAKNELKCTCYTASQLKLWLSTNKAHIPDYDELFTRCDNRQMKLPEMDQKGLCENPKSFKTYMRYIIYTEILLFVLLFAKVVYDYYVFTRSGYLPWPASKMPKLPCDWCFET